MAGITIGQQVLEKVVQRLGGPQQAAARLGISPSLLDRFLEGTMAVPDAVLLKAVDLTLDSTPQEPVPAVRPASPPPKGR
jgi:DNA-binding transcriptional regulator YdaS (Cro superfamily)